MSNTTPNMANPHPNSFIAQAAHLEPASADEELSVLFSTAYQLPTRWPIDFSGTQWNDTIHQSCQPSYSYESGEMLHYAAYAGPSCPSSYLSNYQVGYSSATNTAPSRPRSDPQLDHLLRSMEKMGEYHTASIYQLESPELQALAAAAVQPHCVPVRSIEVGRDGRRMTRDWDEVNSKSSRAPTRQLTRASTAASLATTGRLGTTPRRGGSYGSEAAAVSVAEEKDQPYAQLIFRCLKDALNHEMVLKDIYDWFELNTSKVKNAKTTGWQNSIRHNLSMNGAFYKVECPHGGENGKKGCLWKLTEQALREGVKSTTRYRTKLPNKKRGYWSQNPAPQRQASGAKGGQAARKAARQRRSERLRETRSPALFNGLDETDTRQQAALSSLTPADSRKPGFDASTSADARAAYPSHSISPYYLHSDPAFMQATPRTSRTILMTPLSAYHESFSSSPDLYNTQEMAHLFHLGCDQPLFYDSPESGDEPLTPPSFDGMPMNFTSLLDPDPLL